MDNEVENFCSKCGSPLASKWGDGKYYCLSHEPDKITANSNFNSIRGIDRIPCAFIEHANTQQACRDKCRTGICNWAKGPHCINCRFR